MITSEEFRESVQVWADEIGVGFKEIHLRKMRNKWASCSTRGRLTFNVDLLYESDEMIQHVVIHELLHLRYPNMERCFKAF